MAYQALENFNEYGQIQVQKTLEKLTKEMNSFYRETSSAASAMERLATAAWDLKEARSSGSKYHTGGVVGASAVSGSLKPGEVEIVAKVGETILSPDAPGKAASLISDFISDNNIPLNQILSPVSMRSVSVNELPGILSLQSPQGLDTSSRINSLTNVEIDNIDCSVTIEGNADDNTIRHLETLMDGMSDKVYKEIKYRQFTQGVGNGVSVI